MKKLYILDTNVILYDPKCIYNFHDSDIVIPIIVLEELDRFKKGTDEIHYNARSFIRELNKMFETTDKHLVSLGKNKGYLYINTDNVSKTIPQTLSQDKPDNTILSLTLQLKLKYPKRDVILITKDINLRMKARVFKIQANDYETGKIDDPNKLYKGFRFVTTEKEFIDELATKGSCLPFQNLAPIANECFIFKNEQQSILARYHPNDAKLHLINARSTAGVSARNLEQHFALDILLDPNISLVTLTGTSGSGKTLLSLASAVEQKKHYLQIYLSKPTVPLGNDIGFLPGTLDEKIKPYMESYYDNIEVIKRSYQKDKILTDMIENNKIQVAPITYLRGRSLPKIFFITDECQNMTPHEVKSLITRAGEGTKMILIGDIHQIDSPYLDARSNGLSYLIYRMKGQDIYAHINLNKGERSKLAETASNIL